MRGFKKWMDAHPRQNLRGYFSVNGRDMTDAEIRRVVSYAVEKGYLIKQNYGRSKYNNQRSTV